MTNNNEENKNKNGLSRTDNFYHVVGTIVQQSSTVATTAIYVMGILKLAEIIQTIVEG